MQRLRTPLTLFVLVLLAQSAAQAAEVAERTLTAERALDGGSLSVENLFGSVQIVPAPEQGVVKIEARVVAEGKTPEEAEDLAESVRLEQAPAGGQARFHVAFPLDRFDAFRPPKSGVKGLISRWAMPIVRDRTPVEYDGRVVQVGPDRKATGLAVHVTVTLPYDVSTSIRQSVGTIAVRAMRGDLRLETHAGDIEAERCFGTLTAASQAGKVSVRHFQGAELSVSSDQGQIELLEVRAEQTRLRTVSGAIHGEGVLTDTLSVDSSDGDVRLAALEPHTADIRTGSGRVDVSTYLKSVREASIETDTGDVTLRVGELTHFDLLAETKTGSVKAMGVTLDLVAQDGPTTHLKHGKGGADLHVSAPGGAVTVRPYDASRLDLLTRPRGG